MVIAPVASAIPAIRRETGELVDWVYWGGTAAVVPMTAGVEVDAVGLGESVEGLGVGWAVGDAVAEGVGCWVVSLGFGAGLVGCVLPESVGLGLTVLSGDTEGVGSALAGVWAHPKPPTNSSAARQVRTATTPTVPGRRPFHPTRRLMLGEPGAGTGGRSIAGAAPRECLRRS